MKIFAISDLHTDHRANMVAVNSFEDHTEDVLIVAGDVSDNVNVMLQTLLILKSKYKSVFFTPGNHDVWLSRTNLPRVRDHEFPIINENTSMKTIAENIYDDSLEKIRSLLEKCEENQINTKPTVIQYTPPSSRHLKGKVLICPILSWYSPIFDSEPDLPMKAEVAKFKTSDYRRGFWPSRYYAEGSDIPDWEGISRYIDDMNQEVCHFDWSLPDREKVDGVISFSHFIPHSDLLPEKRFLFFPLLPKMVGSDALKNRVHKLRPDVHVFGHSHFSWDINIEGIRYIQAPLSYPSERQKRLRSVTIGSCPNEPLLIWENGTYPPQYEAVWSDYYKINDRDPHDFTLAPWVEKFHRGDI